MTRCCGGLRCASGNHMRDNAGMPGLSASPIAEPRWLRSALLTAVVLGTLMMHTGLPVAEASRRSPTALESVTLSGVASSAIRHMPGSPAGPHVPAHGGSGGHYADSICLATTPVGQGTGLAWAGGNLAGPTAITAACLGGAESDAGRLALERWQPPPRPPDLGALGVLRL